MKTFTPLRKLPPQALFREGDVMVIFGELFSRGYANGIVDEAERNGLKVIRSTVGRRDAEGKLRPLTPEEASTQPQPFINIPLEAGFDLELAEDGLSPVDQIRNVKMSEWENAKLDWDKVAQSRARGTHRFRTAVEAYMRELEPMIPTGANVFFVHTMAGGVPRAKILMPTMNRVFKGTGDRHLPSERFWNSDLGKLSSWNFDDVTAHTFSHLIELSRPLKEKLEKGGSQVRYLAYGYHGTEVLIKNEYTWQSYAPYLQGWAKMKLEDIAVKAWSENIKATVYNCPEILTNSSSIFQGVEVPLYPLIGALAKENPGSDKVVDTLIRCKELLKPEFTFEAVHRLCDQTLSSMAIRAQSHFDTWPQHNTALQMETLINASEKLVSMHNDEKNLITFVLSEEVFRACGYVMYHESWMPSGPVLWLGHDILAKALASEKTL